MQRSSLCAALAPAALLAIFACGSSDAEQSPATVASSSSASSSSSGGGGAGGAGGQAATGGAPTFVPLDAKTACDQPAKSEMGILNAAAGQHVTSPSLAWSGTDAAVAWAESTATGFDIKFQLLLEVGTTKGSYFTVGSSVAKSPTVTVATNRTSFVVCWDGYNDATSFGCAAVDPSSFLAKVGVSKVGKAPSLTWGSGGYVVAFGESSMGQAQRLHDDATVNGATRTLQVLMGSPVEIVPRASSFALFAPDLIVDADPLTLGATGSPGKANVTAAVAGVSMSASGDALGFAWVDASAGVLTSVAPAKSEVGKAGGARLDDPMASPSGNVAIAGGKSSFAAVWPVTGGNVSYRATDATGAPIGSVSTILSTGSMGGPVALTATSDGFLAASTVGAMATSLHLVHLGCP